MSQRSAIPAIRAKVFTYSLGWETLKVGGKTLFLRMCLHGSWDGGPWRHRSFRLKTRSERRYGTTIQRSMSSTDTMLPSVSPRNALNAAPE